MMLPLFLNIREKNSVMYSLSTELQGSSVSPFGKALFHVKTRIGPFSVQNRAEKISEKIRKLSEDPFFTLDSLTLHGM
jgi:hypothetical protein